MPQDADGSALVSLIWAVWFYWNVYWWLGQLASPEESEEERRFKLLDGPGNVPPASPPPSEGPPTFETMISEIVRNDGSASLADFLGQRLTDYETIVAAFDAGDRDALRPRLSAEVFGVFSDAIAARGRQLQRTRTLFARIEPVEIVDGAIDHEHMEVSARFVSECFKIARDDAGRSLDETPDKSRTVDIWTFARTQDDSTWRVIATEAGAE